MEFAAVVQYSFSPLSLPLTIRINISPSLEGGAGEGGEDLGDSLLELLVAGVEVLLELGCADGGGEALHANGALNLSLALLVLLAVLGGGGLTLSGGLRGLALAGHISLGDVTLAHVCSGE